MSKKTPSKKLSITPTHSSGERQFVNRQFLFSIYDNKSQIYKTLQMQQTKHDALRNFQNEANHPESLFNKFPHDYTLTCVGEFLDDGQLLPYAKPEILATAAEFAKTQSPN